MMCGAPIHSAIGLARKKNATASGAVKPAWMPSTRRTAAGCSASGDEATARLTPWMLVAVIGL